jgi:hypothetical protein
VDGAAKLNIASNPLVKQRMKARKILELKLPDSE